MAEKRLLEFWRAHPEGRIETTVINCKNGEVIVRAEVYVCKEDAKPISTGHAYERENNGAPAVEACEMSAVDKALVIAGYQGIVDGVGKTESAGHVKTDPIQGDPGDYEITWKTFQGKIKDLPPQKILWLAANYTGKDNEAKKAAKAYLDLHPELLASVGKSA